MNEKLNSLLNQDSGSASTSSRYSVVKTATLVDALVSRGYEIASTLVAGTRSADKQGFQKHLLRIRRADVKIDVKGVQPEIILINAYDGTSSVRIMLGLFRFVCSNGLIAGKTFEEYRVRHVGDALTGALKAVEAATEHLPKLEAAVKRLSAVELSRDQQIELAVNIGNEILKDKPNVVNFSPESLLRRRRHADSGNDAFTVLNCIQENAIKGSLTYSTLELDWKRREYKQVKRFRAVKSIDVKTRINRLVWDATEKIAA